MSRVSGLVLLTLLCYPISHHRSKLLIGQGSNNVTSTRSTTTVLLWLDSLQSRQPRTAISIHSQMADPVADVFEYYDSPTAEDAEWISGSVDGD